MPNIDSKPPAKWRSRYKDPEKRLAQIAFYTAKRRDRNRRYVHQYLASHPCINCGEADLVVLEFDHRDPTVKLDSVADFIYRNTTLEKLQAEIDKCDVLCANCHRRKTAKQLNYRKADNVHTC